MPGELKSIEAQAPKLSSEKRAPLADRLIASLFEDKEVKAWAVEVDRRIKEIEADRSNMIPAADATARARAAI